MKRMILNLFAAILLLAGAAPAAAQPRDDGYGVLVMAHGGGPAWNGEVEAMLAPLRRDYRLEIAFGMADAASMDAAVRRLEAQGVRRIGVVRLFISGDSWRERTEQIFGLRPGAPPRPAGDHAGHGAHGGHSMAFWRIDSPARFALSSEGLADAPEIGTVLADRARTLSCDPARESVLILAHGPEDDAENERWLRLIGERAASVRALGNFRAVAVQSLREDWPEKRAASEARIRAFAARAAADSGQLIVIPYRVSGFGPYARVLEGVTYQADRRGLVPSAQVEAWVRRQAETLRAQFRSRSADQAISPPHISWSTNPSVGSMGARHGALSSVSIMWR